LVENVVKCGRCMSPYKVCICVCNLIFSLCYMWKLLENLVKIFGFYNISWFATKFWNSTTFKGFFLGKIKKRVYYANCPFSVVLCTPGISRLIIATMKVFLKYCTNFVCSHELIHLRQLNHMIPIITSCNIGTNN
jgi:hypothetical protein